MFLNVCLEFVAAQLTWTNTLSDVLTNQGVPANTTVGMYNSTDGHDTIR